MKELWMKVSEEQYVKKERRDRERCNYEQVEKGNQHSMTRRIDHDISLENV